VTFTWNSDNEVLHFHKHKIHFSTAAYVFEHDDKIRVMIEAESDEICEKYVDSVIEVIKAKGHVAE